MSHGVLPSLANARRRGEAPAPEHAATDVNVRAWLLCCLIPFFTYVAADVLCILYIDLPSFGGGEDGGGARGVDYWSLFGWILHFFGLLVYVCVSLVMFIRQSPFSSAVLLGQLFAVTIMTIATTAFAQNRVASEMLRPGYNASTTAVQMQWIANVLNYIYFAVMVYHAPYAAAPPAEVGDDTPHPTTIKIEQLMMGSHRRGLSLGGGAGGGAFANPGTGLPLGMSGSMAASTATSSPGGSGASSDDQHAAANGNMGSSGGGTLHPAFNGTGNGTSSMRNAMAGTGNGMSSMRRSGAGAAALGLNGANGSPAVPPRTGGSRTGHHKRTPSTGGGGSGNHSYNNVTGAPGTASSRNRNGGSSRGHDRRKTAPMPLDPIASQRAFTADSGHGDDMSASPPGVGGGVDAAMMIQPVSPQHLHQQHHNTGPVTSGLHQPVVRLSRERLPPLPLNDGSMHAFVDDPPLGALA